MCKHVDAAINLQLHQIYMLGTTFQNHDSCMCDEQQVSCWKVCLSVVWKVFSLNWGTSVKL